MKGAAAKPAPSASVVIASIVGPPFIDDCLASLEQQAREIGAEVLVATSGAKTQADHIRRRFPWARVLHSESRETVPGLRRRGVQQAAGDIVAIIEEHCVASGDWLQTALSAHRLGDFAAVGGPVADDAYQRLRDWVVYFVEYNISLPPAPEGDVSFLNGANIAYRRDVLLRHLPLLDKGYWEVTLHPALLDEGARLRSAPDMIVRHRGPFDFGYYLRQRYLFSRAFAGAQASSAPRGRRAAYLAAAPLAPAMLLARMARRVFQKRCHVSRFLQCTPLIAAALTALVFGEWVGYAFGPGDSLSKVE